ncbi:MAG: 50S ribosomal protein L29 [Alphaproteobacteria bacterium]|nr:50S ribosomal protein L29 [Alphaproteobacteria bacterium]
MKASELRSKTADQLKDLHLEMKKELFNLRFQKATGELQNTSRFSAVRKEVARILSVLNEKAGEAVAAKKK